MDGLLTAVKTVHTKGNTDFIQPEIKDSRVNAANVHNESAQLDLDTSSPDNILSILQSRPDRFDLSRVLKQLDPKNLSEEQFNIKAPSSKAAEVLHVLISTTIPDHWSSLVGEDGSDGFPEGGTKLSISLRATLLRCLSSVAGVGALIAHIRTLVAGQGQTNRTSGNHLVIRDLISVLSALIKPQAFLLHIHTDIIKLTESAVKRQILWKELTALVSAGRILSTAAEALTAVKDVDAAQSISWVGDGNAYASWLGHCICFMASKLQPSDADAWKSLVTLYGRSFSLGYTKNIVEEVYSELLLSTEDLQPRFGYLIDNLRPHEQRTVFESMLRSIGQRYLPRDSSEDYAALDRYKQNISGVARIISDVIQSRPLLEGQLKDWLSTGLGGGIHDISSRRALLAAISTHQDATTDLLSKSLNLFGDKLYIKHTPTSGQEANAQVVLLAAGYVNRSRHSELVDLGRSGVYLNAVSNRLAATSPRSRFLGMAVAMAISALIDSPDKAMKFDLEEMDGEEAKWYRCLTGIEDSIGSIQDLIDWKEATASQQPRGTKATTRKRVAENLSHKKVHTSKIVAIEEILTDSEEEDDDLISYEKPDSDASDSEDDPTLIQRSKPTAPIYIRDLLSYLRDSENAERYALGISTAPSLIRRKISFGTEILEHAEELGLQLIGLQEKYNIEKFHEYRLQSLIALLVALPSRMGPWFVHTFFDADLSQTQRSAMLTAIGLGARELAGHGEEDAKSMGLPALPDSSFPSKKLPPSLEATYNPDVSPVDAISKKLSQATLQPLALDAADSVSGPDALKVRTFSSRMNVEKKRNQREQQRKKTTSKDFVKTLSEGLFFPLTGRFGLMTHSSSSTAAAHNPFLTPHLLRLFIQTTTLIISTLGPNIPNLPSITHDSLALLLSLHTTPLATEPAVLPALLSLFLAVVDLNVSSGSTGEERLVTDFATQVMEIREWVNQVFESAAKEDEEVRMLAAGVLVKLGEVMERYQGRLMGMGVGFEY